MYMYGLYPSSYCVQAHSFGPNMSSSSNKDHTSGNDSTFASNEVQVQENTSISTPVQSTSISEESGSHEVRTVEGNEEP